MKITLKPLPPDQVAYFESMMTMTDIHRPCPACGAPFSEHRIGGLGNYHPQPVKDDILKYVRHLDDCSTRKLNYREIYVEGVCAAKWEPGPCTCGLDAAIAATKVSSQAA